MLITGKVIDWEVPVPVWRKVADKLGKTIFKKVATGAGLLSIVIWTYDIGRCSIKCISKYN